MTTTWKFTVTEVTPDASRENHIHDAFCIGATLEIGAAGIIHNSGNQAELAKASCLFVNSVFCGGVELTDDDGSHWHYFVFVRREAPKGAGYAYDYKGWIYDWPTDGRKFDIIDASSYVSTLTHNGTLHGKE